MYDGWWSANFWLMFSAKQFLEYSLSSIFLPLDTMTYNIIHQHLFSVNALVNIFCNYVVVIFYLSCNAYIIGLEEETSVKTLCFVKKFIKQ